jgi:hypothetical protein
MRIGVPWKSQNSIILDAQNLLNQHSRSHGRIWNDCSVRLHLRGISAYTYQTRFRGTASTPTPSHVIDEPSPICRWFSVSDGRGRTRSAPARCGARDAIHQSHLVIEGNFFRLRWFTSDQSSADDPILAAVENVHSKQWSCRTHRSARAYVGIFNRWRNPNTVLRPSIRVYAGS